MNNDQLAKGQATETKSGNGAATTSGGTEPEQQADEFGNIPTIVNTPVNGYTLGEEGSEAEEAEVQRHT